MYDELGEPGFADNPVDRCYYCKKGLIRELKKIAAEYGIKSIIEGTNISDLKNHRPGHRAVIEEEVYNPLWNSRLQRKRSARWHENLVYRSQINPRWHVFLPVSLTGKRSRLIH